jgi:hypothetical protein
VLVIGEILHFHPKFIVALSVTVHPRRRRWREEPNQR